jgi:hypothetical protein
MRTVLSVVVLASLASGIAAAAPVQVRVNVRNLAPTNSISFAPLHVGFHSGIYDSFNNGQAAGNAIISIAEGGSGSAWLPAFAAADPGATIGTVLPNPAGPLLPGGTASRVFTVNPAANRFFSFGAMVVPSNDYFIGNDSATQYMLFDANGNLNITSITQRARDIWDAGSEVDGAFGAAFLVGSSNDDRIAQNGVVNFDSAGLSVFNGLTTGAGYAFNSQLAAETAVYEITFEIVPAPSSALAMGLAGLVAARRRRNR